MGQKRSKEKNAGKNAGKRGSSAAEVVERAIGIASEGDFDEARRLMLAAMEALEGRNRELEMLLEKLRHERIWKRSEKIDPRQMSLMVNEYFSQNGDREPEALVEPELEARIEAELTRDIEEAKEAKAADGGERRPREPRRRDVERQVTRLEIPESERVCPGCGNPRSEIGEDIRRTLEFVPGRFVEFEEHQVKYACGGCKDAVQTAEPEQARILERSEAGATLLGHAVVSKFVDHMPLNRLAKVYERAGADIPVSTLADWMAGTADALGPLVEALAERVLKADIVRTDATGMKVLDRTLEANVARGTIWCYVGDSLDVLYRYAETGEAADGPWKFLAGRKGYVQADASNSFDRLFNGMVANAIEVGCWGHARRGWFGIKDVDVRVSYPLTIVQHLYRVETLADARGLDPPGRAKLRQERSQPELDKLKRWILQTQQTEPPKSSMSKANCYVLNQWEALTRFVEDGRLSLDNNLTEQQMRAVAMGRRNFLFCGSHEGARRAAVLYSLVRTCALRGVAPLGYLTDVLKRLANGWPMNRIEELLPGNWKPEMDAAKTAMEKTATVSA